MSDLTKLIVDLHRRFVDMIVAGLDWYADGARRFGGRTRGRRHAVHDEREKTAALTRTMPVPTGKRAIDLGPPTRSRMRRAVGVLFRLGNTREAATHTRRTGQTPNGAHHRQREA